MANKLLCSANLLIKQFEKLTINNNGLTKNLLKYELNNFNIQWKSSIFTTAIQQTSFFNKLPGETLWKGCTSVSPAGKKRGRAKTVNKRNIKDLNRGQVIGVGKINMQWPGLTSPIIRGRELVEQTRLPDDPDRESKLAKLRDSMGNFRSFRMDPIDRGWSGSKLPGRSIGPPDPIGGDIFEGFDTRVLELKMVIVMKGNLGRKRRQSAFVVTGNANGLAGIGMGKAIEGRAALRKAKTRAGQHLMHFELCDGHTIFHDFFTQFGYTKIFVTKKPEGYGLKCHRAIKTICEVIGIKDLHANIEGSTNVQSVTKAFLLGLLKQKSHQQIAEEKGLHLVEFRKETANFPKIIASPTVCRRPSEIPSNEIMDFSQYGLDGKIILKKKKIPPFYTKHQSWQLYLRKQEKNRNKDKVMIDMLVNYGELRSFLTDKHPECKPTKVLAKRAMAMSGNNDGVAD